MAKAKKKRKAKKSAKKRAPLRKARSASKRTVKRSPRRSVKRKTRRPAKHAAKPTARRKARRPAKKKSRQPARRKARRPVRKKARRTAKKKARQPARKKSRRPSGKKVRRPAAKKARRPAKRKSKKPIRRKAKKLARRRSASAPRRKKARPRKLAVRRKSSALVRRRKTVRKARKQAPPRFPRAPAAAAGKRRLSLRGLAARFTPAIKPPIDAYRGSKPYLFASYSHKNMKEVFGIIRKLAESRYRIWYDEGIEPGNEWPEEVGKALTACQLFLVFMSPAAMESRNVRNEINLAASENKSIMVVFLQPAELSEGMKLQIGTVQYINRHEMADEEFLDKIRKVLNPDLRG